MDSEVILVLKLLALLVAMQGFCWLLGKGLARRLEWRAVALGWALPLLLLFPWISSRQLLLPADPLQDQVPGALRVPATHQHDLLNDAIHCFVPWELEVRKSLRALHLPLWSDSLEGGSSPWVNPQAQPLAPIAMLTRALPIQFHLLAALALKILLACQGTWVLARVVGISRRASLIAAASFALSGGIMAWSIFPHSSVVAWVPWLTAAAVRLFRGGGPRVMATAALLTAALLLSGQPEVAASAGVFVAITGASLARRGQFRRGFAKATLAAVLGFCLAAPQLLPFALFLPSSSRMQETIEHEMPAYHVFASRPLSWFLPGFGKYMMVPISPRAYGIPFTREFSGPFNWAESEVGYPGLVAFAGSMVSLLAWRRRRVWPFLGYGVLSLLLTAQFVPLAHLIYAVDILKTIAWSRFLLLGCLAFAIAGGMGIDALFRNSRRGFLPLSLIALLVAATLSLTASAEGYLIGLWAAIAAAAVMALSKGRQPLWRAGALALFATVALLDLVSWSRCFLPASDPALFYPRTDYLSLMQQEAAAEGGPWRVVGEEYMLYSSILPVYGMDEVRPHNPLAPMPYVRVLSAAFDFKLSTTDYFSRFGNIDHPFLDFLNVRVIASSVAARPSRTLERIDGERFGSAWIYRNTGALPRFFLPKGAELIAEEKIESYIAELEDPWRVAVFDPRAKAWVGESGSVKATVLWPGRIDLEVPGAGDRLLATSLLQPEGWRTGGLEKVTINGAFLGVHVLAGTAHVELRFRPPGFIAGIWLGVLALAVTLGLLWKPRRRTG